MSKCIGRLKNWLGNLNGEDEPDVCQDITDCVELIPQILISDYNTEATERFKLAIVNICRIHPDNNYAAICAAIIECRINSPRDIINMNLKSWPFFYLRKISHMVLKNENDSAEKAIAMSSLFLAGQSSNAPPSRIDKFNSENSYLTEELRKDILGYLSKVSNNSADFKKVLELWKNANINEETAKVRAELFQSRGEYCFSPEMIKVNMLG
ncbi:MAG TPA: hypothetical protein PK496_09660, partial [Bacteroidales bacterium]|nr:hypothetical protein [Bacteroidales bacterium]